MPSLRLSRRGSQSPDVGSLTRSRRANGFEGVISHFECRLIALRLVASSTERKTEYSKLTRFHVPAAFQAVLSPAQFVFRSQDEPIRTTNLFVPNEVLYQIELRLEATYNAPSSYRTNQQREL